MVKRLRWYGNILRMDEDNMMRQTMKRREAPGERETNNDVDG